MINRCEGRRALGLTSSSQCPWTWTGNSFQQSPIKIHNSHMTKKNLFSSLAERSARQIGAVNGTLRCCFGCLPPLPSSCTGEFSHLFQGVATPFHTQPGFHRPENKNSCAEAVSALASSVLVHSQTQQIAQNRVPALSCKTLPVQSEMTTIQAK